MWLENGMDTAGLNHIIIEYADDFLNKGIMQEQIPDYIMNALENGEIHKVAITVGNNGLVVGANPK